MPPRTLSDTPGLSSRFDFLNKEDEEMGGSLNAKEMREFVEALEDRGLTVDLAKLVVESRDLAKALVSKIEDIAHKEAAKREKKVRPLTDAEKAQLEEAGRRMDELDRRVPPCEWKK